MGITDAAHREYGEEGVPFVIPAHCELPEPGAPRIGGMRTVSLKDGSAARDLWGQAETRELFGCSFELNPEFRDDVEAAGLIVSGEDDEGAARVVELPGRPFFVATLFLPQMLSKPDRPHPLFTAYVAAVVASVGVVA
jgi:CTP synthase (UTP-ammonia lyase)